MTHANWKKICAWCGKHVSGPKDAPVDRTSHGICKACAKKLLAEAGLDSGDEITDNGDATTAPQ